MALNDPADRLGLSIPYDWWPAAPILKEIEAAGSRFVQVPSPPPSVLTIPRDATKDAAALSEALGTASLNLVLHGPGAAPLMLEVRPPRPSAANLFHVAVDAVAPPAVPAFA